MAIYKLKDIIKLNSKYSKEGTINYLELSGINNFEVKVLKKEDIPSRAKWCIDKNTIIIGRVRPLNKNHNYYKGNSRIVASSGFTCFKSNTENVNNKYLWYVLKQKNFIQYTIDNAKGSTYPEISQNDLLNFSYNFPDLEIQNKIIDIIKPIEDAINNLDKQIEEVKKILVKQYESLDNIRVGFSEYIELCSDKYSGQESYLATNAVGEFIVDILKEQNITEKRPSRANLTPVKNSIIISKLDGENKILYIDEKFNYVVSTGFFNFTSEYLDYVVGFLLSEDFKKQKTLLSTGTTMVGLNNVGLNKVLLTKPIDKDDKVVKFLNILIKNKLKLKEELDRLVVLLIK